MVPNAAFSCTKGVGPTIAATGTICIVFVCLTTQMDLLIQSAQPWGSLNFVVITTAYYWTWGHNTHCWICLHLVERVNNAFRLAGCPEIGGSDSVESSQRIIQEKKEFILGRCYQGHSHNFLYTGHKCYELQAWYIDWNWYIVPCNQVPDTEQK